MRFHGLLNDDMSVVVPGSRRRKGDAAPYSVQIPSAAEASQNQQQHGGSLQRQNCTFVEHQDFADMGANVVNATRSDIVFVNRSRGRG